jgi:hypothetical protein
MHNASILAPSSLPPSLFTNFTHLRVSLAPPNFKFKMKKKILNFFTSIIETKTRTWKWSLALHELKQFIEEVCGLLTFQHNIFCCFETIHLWNWIFVYNVCFIFANNCWLHLLVEKHASHYMHDWFGVSQPFVRTAYSWYFYSIRFCTPLEWEESIFP